MTESPDDDRLLSDLLDGLLSPAEEVALNARLQQDEKLRASYRRWVLLHAELHWNHGAAASLWAAPGPQTPIRTQSSSWTRAALLAGIGLVFAIGLSRGGPVWWFTSGNTVASLVSVQGAVSFRTSGGSETLVANGPKKLAAGMLLLDGESAAIQLRFPDGTLISLTGPAELGLESPVHHRLDLRRGRLTAEVRPQSDSVRWLIETPAARVAVLGTILSVEADSDRTRLQVNSGRVRFERLVDGRILEIAAQQSCVATLDRFDDFDVTTLSPSINSWRRTFDQAPPEHWKGIWQPAEGNRTGVMRGVPCVMGNGRQDPPETGPLIHYGVSVRPFDNFGLGQIAGDDQFVLTYFVRVPSSLQIMLGVRKPNGSFGGNFEVRVPPESGALDASGFRTVVIPLREFESRSERYPAPTTGDRPNWLLVTTFTEDAGLEIAEIGFVGSAPDQPE